MTMQINLDEIEVVNNPEKRRFEAQVGAYLAHIDYIENEDNIVYVRTLVPVEIEGHGIASKMARIVLDYARDNDLKVVPRCPFIAAYIKKHQEYQPLVYNPQPSSE